MNISFGALIPVVFIIVETLEIFGVKQKYAHLLAIPLGIIFSFGVLQNISEYQNLLYGIIIGIGAVGSCDTLTHIREIFDDNEEKQWIYSKTSDFYI